MGKVRGTRLGQGAATMRQGYTRKRQRKREHWRAETGTAPSCYSTRDSYSMEMQG